MLINIEMQKKEEFWIFWEHKNFRQMLIIYNLKNWKLLYVVYNYFSVWKLGKEVIEGTQQNQALRICIYTKKW